MTLLELIVAAALAVLLLTMFFWFLVPSMRLSGQQSARVDIQQQTTLAVRKIVADLECSTTDGIGILPTDGAQPSRPVAVGINRLDDVLADGQQSWQNSLAIYYWDRSDHRLYYKEWPPEPPSLGIPFASSRATKPSPQDLLEIVNNNNGTRRSLALGVAEFELRHTGVGDSIGLPLTVRLVLEREVAQKSETERFEMERTVMVRN
ncbi:MAG: hypothetical protein HY319_26615 [Armatimonadetes bacterium]|nr:hypothetical protein [Armatimonadota bacterium]